MHTLYYPTIEFQDLNTLKKSLLVWERVFRIVPAGYTPKDSAEIKAAIDAELVVNLHLSGDEKNVAAENFLSLYETLKRPHQPRVWPAGLSSEDFTRINPEKIEARLLPLFKELSKAIDGDGFLRVQRELVGGYMFYLANAVAKQRSLHLTTDSADSWVVGTFFSQDGNFDEGVYNEAADDYLCNLAVTDLLPEDLSSLPMQKLIAVREARASERQLFRTELEAFAAEVSKCSDKAHAEFIRKDFVAKLDRAKADYKESISFLNKRDIFAALSVGVPAGLSFLSLPGSDPYSDIRLAGGLLVAAAASMAGKRLTAGGPTVGSYLVTTERLGGRLSDYRTHRLFEEFIND